MSALGSAPKTPDEWIKRFLRAAQERFTTAEFLHEKRRFVDQMYLTGYVIECALKALILHDTAESERQSTLDLLTHGASSHDFVYLKAIYEHTGKQFPLEGSKMLQRLVKYRWGTEWRYQVSKRNRRYAASFLAEAQCFLEWVKQRI